jgi:TorA maturation chaperone TorD
MGEATAEVQGFLESLGLHVSEQWRGLPDHVSVELEVLQRLIEHEALAERALDDATATRCRTLRHEFLNRHVLRWVPGVCDDIAARAGTSFYRELALLTGEMLANERMLYRSSQRASPVRGDWRSDCGIELGTTVPYLRGIRS